MRNRNSGTPRRVFGAALRHLRERAELSRADLAGRICKSVSLIESIERGERAATEEVTADLEAVPELRADGILMVLRAEMKDGLGYQAVPSWFADWPGKEALAVRLRSWELAVVPGLLQNEDYARALLTSQIGHSQANVDEQVAARMKRQEILARDQPPELLIVIDEGVLHRPVGGAKVMRPQLGRLIHAAQQPSIVIQVIPVATGVHDGLSGTGFVIADFDDATSVAYQDTILRGQAVEDPKDVAALGVTWDRLRSEALPRTGSLELLEEVAEKWSPAA